MYTPKTLFNTLPITADKLLGGLIVDCGDWSNNAIFRDDDSRLSRMLSCVYVMRLLVAPGPLSLLTLKEAM